LFTLANALSNYACASTSTLDKFRIKIVNDDRLIPILLLTACHTHFVAPGFKTTGSCNRDIDDAKPI
jgi:hypothetical protein